MAIGTISNSEAGLSCRTKLNQALSLWDGMAGVIMAFGGSSAPSKWALCDGSAISRTTYSELFGVVGTSYGSGNGTTTFNLPDLRGKVPAGLNGATFSSLGTSVGAEQHTLSESEIPSHTHGINLSSPDTFSTANNGADFNVTTAFNSGATSSAGSGTAHNNIQPSLVVNYIIYTGV